MKQRWRYVVATGVSCVTLLAGSGMSAPAGYTARSSSAKQLEIGVVVQTTASPFVQQIVSGAKDAAASYGVKLDVVGPVEVNVQSEIQDMEGLISKGVNGIAVVPNAADLFVRPINEAMSSGIPVVTMNANSPRSKAPLFVGEGSVSAGKVLARNVLKGLGPGAHGLVLIGNCVPGLGVLEARVAGLKAVLRTVKGLTIGPVFNATADPGTNYSAWETQYQAHPDVTAMIGVCAFDMPNLIKLKKLNHAKYLAAGFDLEPDTLAGIKDGTGYITMGQTPYLQGYLPVKALVEKLRDKKPIPMGWIDSGSEPVTRVNVGAVMVREASAAKTRAFYAALIKGKYADLSKVVRPLADTLK